MDVPTYILAFSFLVQRGYPKSGGLYEFEGQPRQKYHNVNLKVLPEAPLIFPIHLRKDMKHFSSNGCLSLQYSIPFCVLRGCPEYCILCAIHQDLFLRRNVIPALFYVGIV